MILSAYSNRIKKRLSPGLTSHVIFRNMADDIQLHFTTSAILSSVASNTNVKSFASRKIASLKKSKSGKIKTAHSSFDSTNASEPSTIDSGVKAVNDETGNIGKLDKKSKFDKMSKMNRRNNADAWNEESGQRVYDSSHTSFKSITKFASVPLQQVKNENQQMVYGSQAKLEQKKVVALEGLHSRVHNYSDSNVMDSSTKEENGEIALPIRGKKNIPMRPVSAIDKGHRSGPKPKRKFVSGKRVVLLPKEVVLEEGYPSELDDLVEESEKKKDCNENDDGKKLAADEISEKKRTVGDSDDEIENAPKEQKKMNAGLIRPNLIDLDKKQHSMPSGEIFSGTPWSDLDLNERLVKHLEGKMNKSNPTKIQSMAIPRANEGKDLLIQSPTGTGKTLCYLVPVIQRLSKIEKKITRLDGTLALIISPTRELCLQIYSNLDLLVKAFIWLIPGYVIGGDNKQSEKNRLRKGVNVLVATPGRLLDHIQSTQSFVIKDLCFLVLDEADRLLDMGFERDIRSILEFLNKLPTERQSMLVSATLRGGIRELASIMLKDPEFICYSPNDAVEAAQFAAPSDFSAMLEVKQRMDQQQQVYSLPKGLIQSYVETSVKQRLVALASLLRGKIEQSEKKNFKAVVFFSTCDSVEFHFSLLSRAYWPDEQFLAALPQKEKSALVKITGKKRSNARANEIDDANESNSKADEQLPYALPLLDTSIFKLHGNLTQLERTETYYRFCKADAGILLTTNVSARGLDLPAVDCIVQFDPPEETTEYIHRVGRTARLGRKGEAIIFLSSHEMGYLAILEKMQIEAKSISPFVLFGYLKIKDMAKPAGNPLESILQSQFQRIVTNESSFSGLATHAFHSYCRAYAGYPRAMKSVFHVKNLHLGHVACSFALVDAPSMLQPSEREVKKRRRNENDGWHSFANPKNAAVGVGKVTRNR